MKSLSVTSIVLSTFLLSSTSLAATNNFYIGVKAIDMEFTEKVDLSNGQIEVNDDNGFGIFAGYNINNNWGVEFDYLSVEANSIPYNSGIGVPAGEIPSPMESIVFDVDFQSFGSQVTYKTLGDLYFKVKAGIFYEDMDVYKSSSDDTGVSLSLGGGYRFSNFDFTVDYTLLSTDKEIIGLAVAYNF